MRGGVGTPSVTNTITKSMWWNIQTCVQERPREHFRGPKIVTRRFFERGAAPSPSGNNFWPTSSYMLCQESIMERMMNCGVCCGGGLAQAHTPNGFTLITIGVFQNELFRTVRFIHNANDCLTVYDPPMLTVISLASSLLGNTSLEKGCTYTGGP